MSEMDDKITLLIDPKTKRVGCVLLQAAYGFGDGNWMVQQFDTKAWIVGEGMEALRPYTGTREEWKRVAAIFNKHHSKPQPPCGIYLSKPYIQEQKKL